MHHVGRLIALVAMAVAVGAALVMTPSAHAQEEFTLVDGWFRDRAVEYYDFGTNTPLADDGSVPTQPIWVFIHGMNEDGTPDFVEGQHNIVDTVPGEEGYSDLWQVVLVTVPEDYEPDSITSAAEVVDAGFETTTTDMFVNCPIVPEGSTLEGGEELVQGWHDGEEVFYPDFGANPATAAPIWVLIHGMNEDGTPDFVEGQQNIIDTVPGQADYTAFWQVNLVTVPEDYEANSIRSAADVVAAGYEITQTDMLVNCPVTSVAEAAADGGGDDVTGMPTTGTGVESGGGGVSALYIAFAAFGAAAIIAAGAGGLIAARRRA